MLSKDEKIRIVTDVGPTDKFIQMTRPHIGKKLIDILQISKDAEARIDEAGGLEAMQQVEVLKIAADIQQIMDEIGARN